MPLLLIGCDETASLTTAEHIQRAKDFEAKGDLNAATIELKNAAEKSPQDAQARWLLGLIYLKNGDGAAAQKSLLRAKDLGVNADSIMIPLGEAYLLQKEYNKLLSEIQPPTGSTAKHAARFMQLRADAMLGLGQLNEGCTLFEKSLNDNPDNLPTYWGLVKCAIAKQDLNQAKSLLGRAIKLDPRNSKTHVYLAEVEDISGNPDAALAAYSNALKLAPNNTDALMGRAFMLIAKGDLNAADKDISAARKVQPDLALAQYLQGLLDYRRQKYKEAQTQIDAVLRVQPNHVPSLRLSAAIAYHLGQYEQAERSAGRVLGWLPNDTFMRKLLANIMLKSGRGADASKVLQPLLSNKQVDPQSLKLAGDASLLKRNFGEALGYYQQALTAQPQNISARMGLSMSRLAMGDAESAITELETTARQSHSDTRADKILAVTHLRRKDYNAALNLIQSLHAKHPKDTDIAILLGLAQIGRGDRTKGREAFQHALVLHPDHPMASVMLANLDTAEGKPKLAEKRMLDMLERDSRSLTAMLTLANLARNRKDEAGYVGWLEKAAKANPGAPEPLTLLSRDFLTQRQYDKALAYAKQAENIAPNNTDAVLALGYARLAAKQPESAIESFNKLATLSPGSAQAYFLLATAQLAKGDRKAAQASLEEAVKIQPDHADGLIALASLESRNGNVTRALEIANRLQRQHPASPAGAALEAETLMSHKRYKEAAQAYAKAMHIASSNLLAAKLHEAQVLDGKGAEADAQLLQWLKEHPNDVQTRVYLAQSYLTRNLQKEAAGQYEAILRLRPNQSLALNNLATIYQRLGDARALDMAQRAFRLVPDSASTMDTLGWILAQQGKLQEGLELLEKAHAQAPRNPEIWFHYAQALAKSGNKDKARAELRALLKLPLTDASKKEVSSFLGKL